KAIIIIRLEYKFKLYSIIIRTCGHISVSTWQEICLIIVLVDPLGIGLINSLCTFIIYYIFISEQHSYDEQITYVTFRLEDDNKREMMLKNTTNGYGAKFPNLDAIKEHRSMYEHCGKNRKNSYDIQHYIRELNQKQKKIMLLIAVLLNIVMTMLDLAV
ncbi:hypothetical protein ACJX0J_035150, partial [Zea mays]